MKFLTMCLFLLFPAVVLPANLPPLIPVVSKSVTKEKAISLVKDGGEELRVPRGDLVKGLADVLAKQGGHDTGADNPLTQEEVILAMRESSVVPCDFSKGEAIVYGFRRDDKSKMDGFLRGSRPGEMCLSYKGARYLSLACMNPILDNKPSRPPVVAVAEPVQPKKEVPPAKAAVTPPPDTEWKTVVVTRISDGIVYVPQQVAVASGGVSMTACLNCGHYGYYGGGLSQGGGLIFYESGPVQQNTVVIPVGGNGGHWGQKRPRSHTPRYDPPTIPVGGNGGGWRQVYTQPIPTPPPPVYVPPPSSVRTDPPIVYQNPATVVGTWPVYVPPPSMVGTQPVFVPQNQSSVGTRPVFVPQNQSGVGTLPVSVSQGSGVRTQPFTSGQNSSVSTGQFTGGQNSGVRTQPSISGSSVRSR